MAGQEVGLVDQVGAADRLRAEAQVRDGHRAGLLRVVDEVALGVVVGRLADDLDRVLVGADRAVGAQAVEHRPVRALRLRVEVVVPRQRAVGDVVVDADGEVVLRRLGLQVVEDGLGHAGGEFLRRQAVAAADDQRNGRRGRSSRPPPPRRWPSARPGRAARPRRRAPWCGPARRCACTVLGSAATKAAASNGRYRRTLSSADLLALLDQVLDDLVHRLGAGAHDDHHALGIRRADVVEQLVLPAGQLGELVHRLLHDGRRLQVVRVDRLAALEVDVGVLGRAADRRVLGRQAAAPVRGHQLLVDHRAHVVVRQLLDLLDLGRGAEAVEEVQERHAGFQGGGLGDQRHVHHLLRRCWRPACPSRSSGRP